MSNDEYSFYSCAAVAIVFNMSFCQNVNLWQERAWRRKRENEIKDSKHQSGESGEGGGVRFICERSRSEAPWDLLFSKNPVVSVAASLHS